MALTGPRPAPQRAAHAPGASVKPQTNKPGPPTDRRDPPRARPRWRRSFSSPRSRRMRGRSTSSSSGTTTTRSARTSRFGAARTWPALEAPFDSLINDMTQADLPPAGDALQPGPRLGGVASRSASVPSHERGPLRRGVSLPLALRRPPVGTPRSRGGGTVLYALHPRIPRASLHLGADGRPERSLPLRLALGRRSLRTPHPLAVDEARPGRPPARAEPLREGDRPSRFRLPAALWIADRRLRPGGALRAALPVAAAAAVYLATRFAVLPPRRCRDPGGRGDDRPDPDERRRSRATCRSCSGSGPSPRGTRSWRRAPPTRSSPRACSPWSRSRGDSGRHGAGALRGSSRSGSSPPSRSAGCAFSRGRSWRSGSSSSPRPPSPSRWRSSPHGRPAGRFSPAAPWRPRRSWSSSFRAWRSGGPTEPSSSRCSATRRNHVHAILGGYYYGSRDPRAVHHHRRALALFQPTPDLLLNLGAAEDEMGQRDSAFAHIRLLNRLAPSYAGALCARQPVRSDRPARFGGGRVPGILERMPSFPQAWNNLGAVLERQGKTEAAMEHYRRALAIDSTYRDAEQPGLPLGPAAARRRRRRLHPGRPRARGTADLRGRGARPALLRDRDDARAAALPLGYLDRNGRHRRARAGSPIAPIRGVPGSAGSRRRRAGS